MPAAVPPFTSIPAVAPRRLSFRAEPARSAGGGEESRSSRPGGLSLYRDDGDSSPPRLRRSARNDRRAPSASARNDRVAPLPQLVLEDDLVAILMWRGEIHLAAETREISGARSGHDPPRVASDAVREAPRVLEDEAPLARAQSTDEALVSDERGGPVGQVCHEVFEATLAGQLAFELIQDARPRELGPAVDLVERLLVPAFQGESGGREHRDRGDGKRETGDGMTAVPLGTAESTRLEGGARNGRRLTATKHVDILHP